MPERMSKCGAADPGQPGIVMTPPTRHTRFVVTAFRMDIKKAPSLTAFYKRMSINIITGD